MEREGRTPGIAGAVVAGAMAAAVLELLVAVVFAALRAASAATAYRAWLMSGGWAWLPLWGAAIGVAFGAWGNATAGRRAVHFVFAAALASLPLVWKPAVGVPAPPGTPRSREARTTAIRRWAFDDPASVGRIVDLSHDPDPILREQAMLALGVNLVVADLQGAPADHSSRFEHDPLRDRLRARLEEGLRDPVEAVRAEAARALVKAPRAFGDQPAATETLIAVLDREPRAGSPERLTWLALDAATAVPDSALKASAARFAARAPATR